MLTREQLVALHRSLVDERVLSVYIGASEADPSHRNSWRVKPDHALKSLRTRLESAPRTERFAFEQCIERMESEIAALGGAPHTPGWVAFITADGVRTSHALPVVVPTSAVWTNGVFASPYVRALKEL